MPLVFLDALKKIGFGGLFAWLTTLFAEKLLTDGKLPWILDYLGTYATKEIFTFLLIVICLVAIWIAVHSIRQGFRYVSVLDKLQSLNYQVENQTQNTDVSLGELATICCDGVASCFSIFRPKAGIGCAIRLARPGKSDHEVGYATVARGGALSGTRFQHSRPLSMDSKLVIMLHDKELSNDIVMLCPDVRKSQRLWAVG